MVQNQTDDTLCEGGMSMNVAWVPDAVVHVQDISGGGQSSKAMACQLSVGGLEPKFERSLPEQSSEDTPPNENAIIQCSHDTINDPDTKAILFGRTDATDIVIVKGITFNAADLQAKENSGGSPFAVDLTHPDAPFAAVLYLYKCLTEITKEDEDRTWFRHHDPTELQLDGQQIYMMFAANIDFNKKVLSAITRLYHTMDDEIFACYTEKRCRHFLPPGFADAVLHNPQFIESEAVRDMFVGYHITYNIGECKMILAPVCVDMDWSLYVWNFERRTMVIIDPVTMVNGAQVVMSKHGCIFDRMHKGMSSCKQQFFPRHEVTMMDWETEYLTVEGANGPSSSSGLYTMFYARFFDGKTLTRILTSESKQLHLCNLLHQMLSMAGNRGEMPKAIQEAIDASA